MPKKESKVKEWLEERHTSCPSCGEVSGTAMVERGQKHTPPKLCEGCAKKGEEKAYHDVPEDWGQVEASPFYGAPRELSKAEIAELVRQGAVGPMVANGDYACLLCPAFGIFAYRIPGKGGK